MPPLPRQTDNGRVVAPSFGMHDYGLAGTCRAGCQRRSGGVDTARMPERERAQRVAIADDEVLLREGLAALLREGGYDVIGQASEADGLMELVRREQPDVAIVD